MKKSYNFIVYAVEGPEGCVIIKGVLGFRTYHFCTEEEAIKLYNIRAVEELRKRGDL